MDISPSYNCLLGRPWAVPSTLHQKIKFVTERQLVCVSVEEDMITATLSGAPYVEIDEKAMECSFRSLEFINAMCKHVFVRVRTVLTMNGVATNQYIRV